MAGEGDFSISEEIKWIKHYNSSQKILLLGEGDFSFAACLAKAFGSAANLVATSLDSEGCNLKDELLKKYSRAATHLERLKDLGCVLINGVDAHTMSDHALLRNELFDRIIFNFPHAGLTWKECDQSRQIQLDKDLVEGFLKSAFHMLVENGEVHITVITHNTAHPFSMWKNEKSAENFGFYLVDATKFSESDHPGYENKRGCIAYSRGGRTLSEDSSFPVGQCTTFKLAKIKWIGMTGKERDWIKHYNSSQKILLAGEGDFSTGKEIKWIKHDNSSQKILPAGEDDFSTGKEIKWIKHYNSSQRILLVGEGDFSFATCLAKAFGSAANMVATSLDSEDELLKKYSRAATHLEKLKDLECFLIHEVDAHTMCDHSLLHNELFDRIIFNFPHAGLIGKEHESRQIQLHKELVEGFLKSAFHMLGENGEVHITHKTAHPFTEWKIEEIAENFGFYLVNQASFSKLDYPEYVNKRGYKSYSRRGNLSEDKSFRVGKCSTFKFAKRLFMCSKAQSRVIESPRTIKWIKHYSSSQKILLVGEGDFSFAACLAKAFGSAANMVATSLDSEDNILEKYSRAATHLKMLKDLGCFLIHGVDAHTMRDHPLLRGELFDRIVFNFPHAGLIGKEHESRQIELHRELVEGFLKSAFHMLGENGEVHITCKTGHPFSEWKIEEIAENFDFYLVDQASFSKLDYPEYVNKRGYKNSRRGNLSEDRSFRVGKCSTFKFGKVQYFDAI